MELDHLTKRKEAISKTAYNSKGPYIYVGKMPSKDAQGVGMIAGP
jgi:hypothetical protein